MLASSSRIVSRMQAIQSVRNMSVVSGPPRVKISGTEQIVHGMLLTAGILAVPLWVLANIKHYRGNAAE